MRNTWDLDTPTSISERQHDRSSLIPATFWCGQGGRGGVKLLVCFNPSSRMLIDKQKRWGEGGHVGAFQTCCMTATSPSDWTKSISTQVHPTRQHGDSSQGILSCTSSAQWKLSGVIDANVRARNSMKTLPIIRLSTSFRPRTRPPKRFNTTNGIVTMSRSSPADASFREN